MRKRPSPPKTESDTLSKETNPRFHQDYVGIEEHYIIQMIVNS